MKFQIDRSKYIDSGLVSERFHPEFPLAIYNYTAKTQWERAWDEVTTACRGIIVRTDTNEIIARPFPKFFNYDEHIAMGGEIPASKPRVFKKMDGSLGILYCWERKLYIATRGSFDSPQAIWATEWLQDNLDMVLYTPGVTDLYEIIYPENKIVVDYGNARELVYLASVRNHNGKSFSAGPSAFFVPEVPPSSVDQLQAMNTPNEEGFVLWWPEEDLRLKVKFETYKRLHKFYTGLNEKQVWEWLSEGLDPMAQDVPDEMFQWLDNVVYSLNHQFLHISHYVFNTHDQVVGIPNRKDQAEIVKKSDYPGIVFSMLDGKDWKKAIWKLVKPKGGRVFRVDPDA